MFHKLHEPDVILTIHIDGVAVTAEPGETVAAVFLRQADPWSRLTPVTNCPRAAFCMMGVCFDCLAEIDGAGSVQTCLTQVREGMRVTRQLGKRRLSQ